MNDQKRAIAKKRGINKVKARRKTAPLPVAYGRLKTSGIISIPPQITISTVPFDTEYKSQVCDESEIIPFDDICPNDILDAETIGE